MFTILDKPMINLVWCPLADWDGRSNPERAAVKRQVVRQDVERLAKLEGVPLKAPPLTTDPTNAAIGSLLAEQKGLLEDYVKNVMHKGWGEGKDIGQKNILVAIFRELDLEQAGLEQAINSKEMLERLHNNWKEAQSRGVFGVPSFVVGKEIFWGSDRIDLLQNYLWSIDIA